MSANAASDWHDVSLPQASHNVKKKNYKGDIHHRKAKNGCKVEEADIGDGCEVSRVAAESFAAAARMSTARGAVLLEAGPQLLLSCRPLYWDHKIRIHKD